MSLGSGFCPAGPTHAASCPRPVANAMRARPIGVCWAACSACFQSAAKRGEIGGEVDDGQVRRDESLEREPGVQLGIHQPHGSVGTSHDRSINAIRPGLCHRQRQVSSPRMPILKRAAGLAEPLFDKVHHVDEVVHLAGRVVVRRPVGTARWLSSWSTAVFVAPLRASCGRPRPKFVG